MEKKMVIVVLLILTAILWGSSPILEKTGLRNTSPLIALTIRSVGVAVILLIMLSCMGKLKELFSVEGKTVILFTISGIMAGLLGMWTYFGALKAGATSKIVPIAASYPLITVLLSILILKEGVTLVRLIGTLLIIAGIWLVK
ncbi:MAG: EamA family transporter [Candidatus Omnitrophica bacterium]|nr:EamA family transporter [Candidatus Omnitrophota bacterium]